jgi:F420-non-reducing hydrogenase small subunit
MSDKPKVGFYWCASCGGCEESVVDLAEDILTVVGAVDIVFWPVAMDFKKKDVEAMADKSITVTFLNGAIRTSEQEEMAQLLRRKSQLMIAYGSCAHTGGIPSLTNQFDREQILKWCYDDCPSVNNPEGTRPQTEFKEEGRVATLPEFRSVVRALDQVVDVDYYIPGCAPNPKLLLDAVMALLSGKMPPKGAVLAPDRALCDDCPRIDTKPSDLKITEFKRPVHDKVDPEKCMLAQGFVCMGPATRSGCGERCIRGNMPCTGCFGPTSHVQDHGAKILSALTSVVGSNDEAEIDKIMAGIPDPVGTFYRYGMAKSLLRRRANVNGAK